MNFGESLEELRGSILRDASTLKSGPPDHYWTDTALALYINEAYRRFARRSFCIRDNTTAEVTQVELVASQSVYSLHPSILRVTSARHQDSRQDLVRVTHAINYARINPQTDPVNYAARTDLYPDSTIPASEGQPLEYATDEGLDVEDEHQIQLLVRPQPNAAQAGKIIYLRTIRTPLVPLTLDDLEQPLEIPVDCQLDMLEWAAYRALRNWDGDAEDRAKADKHKERFEEAIKEIRREVEDKMLQPPTWAFGQGGFSYIHN